MGDMRRRILQRAERTFKRAAQAWERGNNSGCPETLKRCDKRCDELRREAEEAIALAFQGHRVAIDYPGLYPCFHYEGRDFFRAIDVLNYIEREENIRRNQACRR